MKKVAADEAKTRLLELLAEVESRGEQVTITRRGRAVARLVPAVTAKRGVASRRQQTADTLAQLRSSRISLNGPLKDSIAGGRD